MDKKWFSILIVFAMVFSIFFSAPTVSAKEIINSDQTQFEILPRINDLLPKDSSKVIALGEPGTSFRYDVTIGITGEPYPVDTDHLNTPNGLFIDSLDNLYVSEIWSNRVVSYNSIGLNLLELGTAGQPWHHDSFLSTPRDIAVDPAGNIWVVSPNMLKQFDIDGNMLQIFPADDPWQNAQDNGHFDTPQGISFDSVGLMYVADSANQRIQIFDISGGSPVYKDTIGVTGEIRSDNTGFNWPHRVAFDSSDRLYVADEANYRIQRCTKTTSWNCETFFGVSAEWGNDETHLGDVYGLTIRNDYIYIADTGNQRVFKCSLAGSCEIFAGETSVGGSDNHHFWWPTDVAVDSLGKVYVADETNFRVQIYDSVGVYLATRGMTGVPYVPDEIRLNTPWGLAVTSDGGLLVTENSGVRLIKYDSNLNQVWAHGVAGVPYGDTAYSSIPGNPAEDSQGKIYFPDIWNHQVVILDADGEYLGSMGVKWEPGDDQSHFNCPHSVAISPVNGDIFVVDHCNQRVQVFTQDRFYKTTIGVTGETGSDNDHLNGPTGVAIDKNGNIYIADRDNYRVQKCTLVDLDYSCTTFVGETGVFDNEFNHLYPGAVTVDKDLNVYVTDEWNSRVQVYDEEGAYLTTLGGAWGYDASSQFTSPLGVAVDSSGDLYISDTNNHRIQKFAIGYPEWRQVNLNGFGDINSRIITALQTWNDNLYGGTYNPVTGGQLWLMSGDGNWIQITENGFGNSYNVGIDHLLEYKGNLYASTWADDTNGGEIWRITSPSNWERVATGGFGDPSNSEIFHLEEFNDYLYAITWSSSAEHGTEIWRSPNGDLDTWSRVVSNGFNEDANNIAAMDMVEFMGYLYTGTYNYVTGGEVWRTSSGAEDSWTQVNMDGFGEGGYNWMVSSFEVFNGVLYASTGNPNGAQIWSTQDGEVWIKVTDFGLSIPANWRIEQLMVFDGQLIALTYESYGDGLNIITSPDGINWSPLVIDGFGDSNNRGGYWSHSAVIHQNNLYFGTNNPANGGEIWKYEPTQYIYLPMIKR